MCVGQPGMEGPNRNLDGKGDEEREKGMVSLKNFKTGEQKMMSLSECIGILAN